MTGGTRLTVQAMSKGDWRALASALPKEWLCDELQRLVKMLAWRESACPPESLIRRICRALGVGVCEAGPFRVVRSGRWGIEVEIDGAYRRFERDRGGAGVGAVARADGGNRHFKGCTMKR